ncbi:hypothetical protein Leryth_023807 [Lithospermum erythrorhizon]|nr:hypothetical protein Leryth_023807 [Lithospermum erythrorhizon]
MEGGVGSSRSASCFMMAFGDNNSMMMMPPINTTNNNSSTNNHTLSWNLCNATTQFEQDLNSNINNHHHHAGSSSMMIQDPHQNNNTIGTTTTGCYFMESNNTSSRDDSLKAKIMAHPHYHRLLAAYVNCQKIGAPPEVVVRLEEACASAASIGHQNGAISCIGEDPSLDQFMEAYCEMLMKYEQELSKPFNEAMLFLSRIECQFKALAIASDSAVGVEQMDRAASSEEDVDVIHNSLIDPQAEDRELKGQLLRKYSGYLGSLKQEFMKKRKKGKLPKEARQQLLDWWSRHYKWPYPSESQKLALAEATGLDQKQINNWFINQRKRHWKPSEDMQFVVMDAAHHHPTYYLDNNVMINPFPMDISPALL